MRPDKNTLDEAMRLIGTGRHRDALDLLDELISKDLVDWNALYLAGQCHRFLGDVEGAVNLLSQSADAAPKEAPVFLALGVALQLRGDFSEACAALGRAIEIDFDYALAFNSLAMTQKLSGELEKAAYNYDAGCLALARRIVKALRNERGSLILKHRDTRGLLWMERAVYGASYLVATQESLTGIALPAADLAWEEERTERRGGLYWEDLTHWKGETVRLFLPNFFNTFRETLRNDQIYSTMLGNRATVLDLLHRGDEARQHREEAVEFLPAAV